MLINHTVLVSTDAEDASHIIVFCPSAYICVVYDNLSKIDKKYRQACTICVHYYETLLFASRKQAKRSAKVQTPRWQNSKHAENLIGLRTLRRVTARPFLGFLKKDKRFTEDAVLESD